MVGILEQCGCAAPLPLVQYGVGTIYSSKLDRRIVEQGREIRRRQGGIDALDVTRISLLDDQLALRFALELVAVQQPEAGGSIKYHCQFPREIVRVRDAGVAS